MTPLKFVGRMKTVIEGVLSGSLPWGVVGTGAAPALRDTLAGIHFAARGFTWMTGAPAVVLGIALVVAVCAPLYRAGRTT
jgi:hypothetical protein